MNSAIDSASGREPMGANLTFRPVNEDHAIENVKFAIVFNDPMRPSTIKDVERHRSLWAEQLPAISLADVEVEAGSRTLGLPGLLFSFHNPDGSFTWMMHVAGIKATIECNVYSRWERVWRTAAQHFANLLVLLSNQQSELQIAAVEFTVSDVFLGAQDGQNLDDLLCRASFIAPYAFEAVGSWHSNSGWFDDVGDGKILHNLNCDSVIVGDSEQRIRISHFQQFRPEMTKSLRDHSADHFAMVDTSFAAMHEMNKKIIRQMLVKTMRDKIKIDG